MRTRFYIEKRKDGTGKLLSADRPVFMSVSFGGNRVIIGTGIKIDLNGWDPVEQRVLFSYPGAENHNNWLDYIKETASKTIEVLEHSAGEIDSSTFHQVFQQLKPKYSTGFYDLFFQFMESNSSAWSNATYRKVRTLYKLLREFEDHSGFSMSFQNMNAEFLDSFTNYCTSRRYGYSTTYKSVNNLVWFLNWSTRKGYNVNTEYRQFYKLMEVPDQKSPLPLFLHWEELMQLKESDFENRKMERVRDLFCFMCFAGLRFSELQNLKKEDMKPAEIIIRKPSGNVRLLPMNKYALHIHQKYENKYYLNNTAFPSMSIITMNKYLRLIGKELGLTRTVPPLNEGEERLPLYRRLTAGIAVNTFIKNALELDVPLEIISGFTGVQNDSRVRRLKSDLAVKEIKKFDQK